MRGNDDRVDGEVRHRAVAALPADRDLDFVGGGHHWPCTYCHLARRQPRPIVQSIDLVRRKALEESLLHHHLATATAFLGRLEDHIGGAVEVARLGEIARRTEEHRRVAVVAAGVHAAFVLRAVLEAVPLVHRQAIHVGAQPDGAAASLFLSRNHADDAGLRQSLMHLDAPARELVGDEAGGAALLEGELRMRVDIAPHRGELTVIAADALDRVTHVVCRRSRGSTA